MIVSAEEIVETDEFRKDPMRTTVPYFLVDAGSIAPSGRIPVRAGAVRESIETRRPVNAIATDENR